MRQNLEAERGRAGLSKVGLARILGVSKPTMYGYIADGSIPSEKLEKLADMFGVSCDYLLGRTRKREPYRP